MSKETTILVVATVGAVAATLAAYISYRIASGLQGVQQAASQTEGVISAVSGLFK